MYTKGIPSFNQFTSDGFHLMHLLTTNPAAALPPIFPSNIHTEHISYKVLSLGRGGNTAVYPESFLTPIHDTCKMSGHEESGELVKKQRSYSELYATKEEMDQIGNCGGGEGEEFDFTALLPADYP